MENITETTGKEEKKISAEDALAAVEKYETFAMLHHLQYNGNTQRYDKKLLKDEPLKNYTALKKEIAKWDGNKPKNTCTVYAAGLAKNIRLVEGYAVPESLYNEIKANDSVILDLYF